MLGMIDVYSTMADLRRTLRDMKIAEHVFLYDVKMDKILRKGKRNKSVSNTAFKQNNRVNKSRGCKGRHC